MADVHDDWGRLLSDAATANAPCYCAREMPPYQHDGQVVTDGHTIYCRSRRAAERGLAPDLPALAARIAVACRDFRWGTFGADHESVRLRWRELQSRGVPEWEALHRARAQVVEAILREGCNGS